MTGAPQGVLPALFGQALEHLQAGRLVPAEHACRALLAQWPREAAVRRLMGMVRQQQGDTADAEAQFAAAVALAPADPDGLSDYGQCLLQNGNVDEAARVLSRAVAADPRNGIARHNLALALAARGDTAEAEAAFGAAIAAAPRLGGPYHHLAQHLFRRDPAAAERMAAAAVERMPRYGLARLHHAVLLEELARHDEARRAREEALARDPKLAAVVESRAFLLAEAGSASRFGCRFDLLAHALSRSPKNGHKLEFGVRWGVSARWLAHRVDRLHGFDSLQGLPEAWLPGEGAGSYGTGGTAPPLPANVTLHAGWFEDTLPLFLERNAGPVSFVHVDCDIYSSTKTVLTQLAPRLEAGAVIVFDEFHSYPGWQEHEFRAFQEFLTEQDANFAYLGFNIFGRQAAVQLL